MTGKIEKLIMPCVEEVSAELIEFRVKHRGRTLVFEIIADKAMGGITVGECSMINRNVVKRLEGESFLGQDYVVEVSSPGIDRPLKTQKDFLRVIGRKVRFYFGEPVDNKREYIGIIKAVDERQVMIEAGSTPMSIPLEKIHKAVQMI